MPYQLILAAIWERKFYLIIAAALVFVAVYFLLGKKPKQYVSAARMATGITIAKPSDLKGEEELLQPFIIQNRFDNLLQQMQSNQMYFLVGLRLLKHDLKADWPYRQPKTPDLVDTATLRKLTDYHIAELLSLKKSLLPDTLLAALKSRGFDKGNLQRNLSMSRLSNSDFVEVVATTNRADLSADLANTFINSFIEYYSNQNRYKSGSSVDFLEELVAQKKRELDAKVNELKNFKLQNQVINLYEQTKTIVNQIKDVEMNRTDVSKRIESLKSELSQIDGYFSVEQKLQLDSTGRMLHQKILDLRKQQIEATNATVGKAIKPAPQQMGNELIDEVVRSKDYFLFNPKEVKSELVRRKLTQELDLIGATEELRSLDAELTRLQAIVQSFAPMEASIGALEREITVASEVYIVLLNKLNNAHYTAMQRGDTLQVSETALMPDKAQSSKRMLTSIIATVAAVFLSIIGILAFEFFDYRIKRPIELLWRMNLHALGRMKPDKKFEAITNKAELRWKIEASAPKPDFILLLGESKKELTDWPWLTAQKQWPSADFANIHPSDLKGKTLLVAIHRKYRPTDEEFTLIEKATKNTEFAAGVILG